MGDQPSTIEATEYSSEPVEPDRQRAVTLAIHAVARRFRLDASSATEFFQDAWVHLLTHPSILDKFNGQSSLHTYLFAVFANFLRNQQQARRGRWRPSSEARHLGEIAVELERLCERDGLSRDEAIETLCCRYGGAVRYPDLERLADRVRIRSTLRSHDAGTAATLAVPSESNPHVALIQRHVVATANRIMTTLRKIVNGLPPSERSILVSLHVDGRTIRDVARESGYTERQTYRKVRGLHRTVRTKLLQTGHTETAIMEILRGSVADIGLLNTSTAASDRGGRHEEGASSWPTAKDNGSLGSGPSVRS